LQIPFTLHCTIAEINSFDSLREKKMCRSSRCSRSNHFTIPKRAPT
jgi:hypothetical protein